MVCVFLCLFFFPTLYRSLKTQIPFAVFRLRLFSSMLGYSERQGHEGFSSFQAMPLLSPEKTEAIA